MGEGGEVWWEGTDRRGVWEGGVVREVPHERGIREPGRCIHDSTRHRGTITTKHTVVTSSSCTHDVIGLLTGTCGTSTNTHDELSQKTKAKAAAADCEKTLENMEVKYGKYGGVAL